MSTGLLRLVIDTATVVAAFRSSNGGSNRVVSSFDRGRFYWLISTPLLIEYEDVLLRPEQMRVHRQSREEIVDFLDTLAGRATPVELWYNWRPQLRDPNDEMVLATAINGGADAIVTHNTADFLPAAHRFGLSVITPGSILKAGFRL